MLHTALDQAGAELGSAGHWSCDHVNIYNIAHSLPYMHQF